MDKKFFGNQIDRLRRVYSPASLADDRVQILWGRFKEFDNFHFDRAVSHLIGEFTTNALPSVSRFEEALAKFKPTNYSQNGAEATEENYDCCACRDFGFGWIGDTVTRCTCATGRIIPDDEITKAQKSYDVGRQIYRSTRFMRGLIKDLPYDPQKRGAV